MNRRNFLCGTLATGALAACSTGEKAAPESTPAKLGVGLFTLPKMLEKDFAGAMAMLSRLGYQEIETFGPYPFSDPAQIKFWNSVTPSLGFKGSGFFGHPIADIRKMMDDNGLTVPSMHTDIETLQMEMGPLAEAAKLLGATYVVLPQLPPEHRKTLDDYKRAAELFNKIGADAQQHGVKFGYHNHGYGLKVEEGKPPFETMIEATDPGLVSLEMDIFWTIAGGADPVEYLKRYKGRYKMLHLKDMKTIQHFNGDGGTPGQWFPLFQHMTHLGGGAVDLKAIIETARANGVEHYFVEQDNLDDPMEPLGKSAAWWKEQMAGR